MTSRLDEVRAGVKRAVTTLGFDANATAFDGILDPVGLLRALTGSRPVLVRAGRPLPAEIEGHGPLPHDGVWLKVVPSSHHLDVVPLLGGHIAEMDVFGVTLSAVEEWCCDAPKCEQTRTRYTIVLELDEEDATDGFVVHEGTRFAQAHALALAFARALHVELHEPPHPAKGTVDLTEGDADEPLALEAEELAQWSLRCECGRWVVRDRTSLGPRAALPRELALLGIVGLAAIATGYGVYAAVRTGDTERAAIWGVCSFVATVGGYAVAQIARHSARYHAEGAPVLFAYRDRFVASPWVSRRGEVMLAPEGRYGAALSIAGIRDIARRSGPDDHALVCESDHGTIELGRFESERLSEAWQAIVKRVLTSARHVPSVLLLVALGFGAMGCRAPAVEGPRPPSAHPSASSPASVPAASSAASLAPPPLVPSVAVASTTTAPAREPRAPLAMIEDDVPAALARGRATKLPVLVDVWAAWCHTCLSMKSFVLPSPAVAELADRVVFASVDTENAANEAFLARYHIGAWPTFLLLEPSDGSVLALWEGSASVDEFRAFVLAGLDARGAKIDPALAALQRGGQAQASGRCTEAVTHYQSALARGGANWLRRADAVKGLIFCQRRLKKWDTCVDTGLRELPLVTGTSTPADVAGTLLDCAEQLAPGSRRSQAEDLALSRLRSWTDAPPQGASVDDRADTLATLAEAMRARGDSVASDALLSREIALLEAAAASASSVHEAATFDYARMNAYLASRQGERAVALFEQRTRELPDHYEPYARLAQTLVALHRYAEAEPAIDAALARVKGPRRARYQSLKAEIQKALGR